MRRLSWLALSFSLLALDASAQPAAPQPGPAQPGPAQPGPAPAQPGAPARRPGAPPAVPQIGPNGQPLPPGMQRRPGGPQGQQRRPQGAATPSKDGPVKADIKSAEAETEEFECKGHGPLDSPHEPNWYQGLIGVNNEKAVSPNFLDRLLWRYENTKDECDPKNQPPPVLAMLLNFGILVVLLFRFGRKPIVDGLLNRKKHIMADVEAAAALRDDAQDRLEKYEDQLENIAARRKALMAEYRAQAEADKKRLLAEAEEKSAQMIKEAHVRVEQELRQAESDLLHESIEAAVAAAEELLKKRSEAADQTRLAEDYLKSFAESVAKSSSGTRAGSSGGAA